MSKKVNPHIRLIAAALLPAIWSATTTADIIYVDPNAPGPIHNGNSWPKAYNYLPDALTDAGPGDQIRVANGTYRPDQDADHPNGSNSTGATFALEDGVEIYGGYAGYGAPDPNARDTDLYKSILTGVLSTKNSLHVVTGSGTNATAVLDGFTITGGNAASSSGGGMFNYNPPGSPTVLNCLFKGNSTAYRGGGMYNWSGSAPTLIDCSFENNLATLDGGGIYNTSASPEISNCTFTGNSASRYGGGLCNDDSDPIVINCTFSNNIAGRRGGGTYNLITTTDLEFVNCTYTGNSAGEDGGAMYNKSAHPQVTNCAFTGNYADIGGAMYNNASDPCLINCTFADNDANENGGGIFNYGGAIPTIANCVFWANTDTNGTGTAESAQIQGGFPQVTYSCIQDEDPNDGDIPFDDTNIDYDPMFVRDPNDGGDGWGDDPCTPGLDEGANDDFGDLHLLPGSPCIDAADNTAVPPDTHDLDDDGDTSELTPLDLDYNPRFIDDPTTPDTGRPDPPDDPNVVDMGAYEFAPEPPKGVAGDIDGDGDVDLVDFAILSYQWLDAPGDPSADIAPPGGNGEVNSEDLLVVAANWLTGTEVPAGAIIVNLSMDESWMYQNLPGSNNSELTATASIIDDPALNSGYTYEWEFVLPGDVTIEPTTLSGGGAADTSWNFAAPNVNQPQGLSDSGQPLTVKVTVTGVDYANTGSAEAQFGIALLGDVNNDRVVNVADRSIINAFWRTGAAGSFTLKDCDINSDTAVNVADRSIANAVWRGLLCQNSVTEPCPFR